jgi:16S rRNA processing protein RimM
MLVLGAELEVAHNPTAIVRRAGTGQRPIVRLEGVDSREAAEALRGRDAPKREEGEWWAHELEGCSVFDGEQLLGKVERMLELPSCEALEVMPPGGGSALLIPMVKDAVRSVHPEARRIEVNAGFLDPSPPASGEPAGDAGGGSS